MRGARGAVRTQLVGPLAFGLLGLMSARVALAESSLSAINLGQGSALGGQRIAITGSGFSTDIHDGANLVSIGTVSRPPSARARRCSPLGCPPPSLPTLPFRLPFALFAHGCTSAARDPTARAGQWAPRCP